MADKPIKSKPLNIVVPSGAELDEAIEAGRRGKELHPVVKYLEERTQAAAENAMRHVEKLLKNLANIKLAIEEDMMPMSVDADYLCKTAANIERAIVEWNTLATVNRVCEARNVGSGAH